MKAVILALLIVQCTCHKLEKELRIPSVSELTSYGGSVTNIGGNNGLGGSSIGNIATVVQTNINTGGSGGNNNNGIGNNGAPVNIGNIANVNQNNLINSNYVDEDRYINRPCQVYDIYCIKKYFANHSKCKISKGPVPEPKYRAQATRYISRLNFTVDSLDVLYSGLNGRITEFYVNKKSDNLVLTVSYNNILLYSPKTYYRFHRRGREPIVTTGFLYIDYNAIETTTIIPFKNELQLEKSETTAFNNPSTFLIDPRALTYPDPSVQETALQLQITVGANSQEALLTDAPFMALTFIQDSICDFGIKLL